MRRQLVRLLVRLVALGVVLSSPRARAEGDARKVSVPALAEPRFDPPDHSYTYSSPKPYPTFAWFALQLLPSPEVAIGEDRGIATAAFGLRWQLTPALWSWGVHRRVSGWRFFIVDPLARMSGSIALEQHFEYIAGHVDRLLVRPGVKATFPLVSHGEYLAFSIGSSVYRYDDRAHAAYDVGLYTLFGMFGAVATIAPEHRALTTIATLRIRYF